jgi:predicted ribosomally synthesized peptide with SipW-like signal peptide
MRKLVFICLALVVALGSIGVGYALWSDSLYIEGTINTGDIGLIWSQGQPWDTEPVEKDVSHGECEIVGDTLFITVFNAYPCIEYHFPIDLHGVGSVPVHTAMTVVGGTGNPSWVCIPDMGGLQIHEGGVWDGEIVIHLDNTAEQNSVYTFSIQLDYWQYNEDDVAGPLVPFQ